MSQPALAILHDIPGRLRIRLPSGARTERIAETMASRDGVVDTRWSPRTRSLLVRYRPGEIAAEDVLEAVANEAGVAAAEAARTSARANGGSPAPVAGAVIETVGSLNRRIVRATGGTLSLGLLVPVALTLWALRDIVRGPLRPLPWSTALWYAHGLFRDYNLTPGPD